MSQTLDRVAVQSSGWSGRRPPLRCAHVRTVDVVRRQRVLTLLYGGSAFVCAAFGLAWWALYDDAVLGVFFLVLATLSLGTQRLLTQPLRRRAERAAERQAMSARADRSGVPTDRAAPVAMPSVGGEPSEAAGQIVVERPGGYYVAVLRGYRIFVDGTKVATVRNGRTVSFTVAPGPHVVAARVDWSGSPAVPVHVPAGGRVTLDVEPAGDAFVGMFSTDGMLTLTVRPAPPA